MPKLVPAKVSRYDSSFIQLTNFATWRNFAFVFRQLLKICLPGIPKQDIARITFHKLVWLNHPVSLIRTTLVHSRDAWTGSPRRNPLHMKLPLPLLASTADMKSIRKGNIRVYNPIDTARLGFALLSGQGGKLSGYCRPNFQTDESSVEFRFQED